MPGMKSGESASMPSTSSSFRPPETSLWTPRRSATVLHLHQERLELFNLCGTHQHPSIHPLQWKCDETGLQENLWLNLSTGFIGCGRQVS